VTKTQAIHVRVGRLLSQEVSGGEGMRPKLCR
jgi:hypothetical protein